MGNAQRSAVACRGKSKRRTFWALSDLKHSMAPLQVRHWDTLQILVRYSSEKGGRVLGGDLILLGMTSSSSWMVDGPDAAAIAIAGGDREASLKDVGGSVTRSGRCATACSACLPGVFRDTRPRYRCQAGKPVIELSEFPSPPRAIACNVVAPTFCFYNKSATAPVNSNESSLVG